MFSLKILFDQKATKTLFYICAIKFPKFNVLSFPLYMFLIYVQLHYKNKAFRIRSIPDKLMRQLIVDNRSEYPIDVNNTIVLSVNTIRISNIGKLVKLLIYNRSKWQSKLVHVLGLNTADTNQVLCNDTLFFNLKLKEIANDVVLCKLQSIENIINFASYVDLSLINTEHDVVNAITDELLTNYFKTPKLIRKNDVIAIDVIDYCAKYHFTHNKINEIDAIYFKCNKIRYEENYDCDATYFCCSSKTTLKQSANTQSYRIPMEKAIGSKEINYDKSIDPDDYTINVCPFGLETYENELLNCMKPFLNERNNRFVLVLLKMLLILSFLFFADCRHLKPTFLLKGPRGVGKSVLVRATTKKLGINLYKVNPLEVQSQTYAQNEIKTRNFMLKAKLCSPCVVWIENFEVC